MSTAAGRRAALSLFVPTLIALCTPSAVHAADAARGAPSANGGVDASASATGFSTQRAVAFRVQFQEQVTFTGAPPCFALSQLQGKGQSPQLGAITMAAQDCINPIGVFDPNGRNAYAFASLPPGAAITVANGDQIFVTTGGLFSKEGRLSGYFVITGGTGAFFGVTGGGWLSGYEVLGPGPTGQGTIDGQGVILR